LWPAAAAGALAAFDAFQAALAAEPPTLAASRDATVHG
jgi:hypothetical protein